MVCLVKAIKNGPFVLDLENTVDIDDAIEFAVRHNLHLLDLLISNANQIEDPDALLQKCRERGLEIGAIGTGGAPNAEKVYFSHPNQENRERAVELIKQMILLAVKLGHAKIIIGSIQGQKYTASTKTTPETNEWKEEEWPIHAQAHGYVVECMTAVCDFAEIHGITIVLEVLNGGESNLWTTPTEANDVFSVVSTDEKVLSYLIDSYHWICQGWSSSDWCEVPIGYAHLVGHARQPPGRADGLEEEELQEFSDYITERKFDGAMVAECLADPDRDAAMIRVIDYASKHFTKA